MALSVALITTCDALYSKTHVSVVDAINGDAINVHCFSGDDDLGYHQLAFQQQFSWSFRYSLITATEFFCTIHTQYGSGSYKVYGTDIMLNRCGLKCVWQVQNGGPCLEQSRGAGLWCLPWKNGHDHYNNLAAAGLSPQTNSTRRHA